MSCAVEELKQIPFSQLIGAPLKAAIEAQALAAQSTIEFIYKVGFKQDLNNADDLIFKNPQENADAGELRYVTFQYKKRDETNNSDTDFALTIPILSIVPIPYIRIDEMTIDFKAKLTDTIVRKSESSVAVDTSSKGSFGAFWSPVKMDVRVSAAYKNNSSSQASQAREYSLDIHVRAVEDSMPAGLSRVLDMLEDAIKDEKKK